MPDSLFGSSTPDGTGAPTDIPINAVMPPYMKNMTFGTQPNMPGQLPQLARDLQNGGFAAKTPAGHKSIVDWLNSIYQPPQSYKIGAPPVVKPKTPTPKKPLTPVVPVTPAGPSGWNVGTTNGGGRNSR